MAHNESCARVVLHVGGEGKGEGRGGQQNAGQGRIGQGRADQRERQKEKRNVGLDGMSYVRQDLILRADFAREGGLTLLWACGRRHSASHWPSRAQQLPVVTRSRL